MNRRPLKITAFVIAFLAITAAAIVAPVDRTPITATGFYNSMREQIKIAQPIEGTGQLKCAWSRVNITPGYSMPMAGYAPRASFSAVHDSLYARILTVNEGVLTVSFVTVDLLLFPPALRDRLNQKLDSANIKHKLYLGATHTHNGVGGWDDSFVGRWSLGRFDHQWVEATANELTRSLGDLEPKPATVSYWESDAHELVENRVDRDQGETDGMIRGIEIVRNDSSRALVYSFSAHPTSIDKSSRELSGDYPGAVTNALESEVDFAMFMAGMVGSHRLAWVPHSDYDLIAFTSQNLTQRIDARQQDPVLPVPTLRFLSVPVAFGPSQLRISDNWKVRDWIFRSLLRPLTGNAVVLEIGNIVFIGLPCDFSGEIFKVEGLGELARSQGKHVIITSFNGDYDGYITLDRHYDQSDAEEITTLNWVGPGFGEYFTYILTALISQGK